MLASQHRHVCNAALTPACTDCGTFPREKKGVLHTMVKKWLHTYHAAGVCMLKSPQKCGGGGGGGGQGGGGITQKILSKFHYW